MTHLDDGLLAQLYGSVEHESNWVTVLDTLRERFGVRSVVAQLLSSGQPFLQQRWVARDSISLRYAHIHDSWANSEANPRFRSPSSYKRVSTIGSDFRTYGRSERALLRDGLARCGLGPAYWAAFGVSEEMGFALVLHRAPGEEQDIRIVEEAALQALLPHLQQVVQLQLRMSDLTQRVDMLERANSAADVAMLICDSMLRVRWSNPQARTLLADSRHLTMRRTTLTTARTSDAGRLRQLVAQADETTGRLLALGTSGDDPVHLRATRNMAYQGFAAAAGEDILLTMATPERRRQLCASSLRQLFGLTMAEARLAVGLVLGRTVTDHAAQCGISPGTARIQLKQLFGKTGTNRQADLVQLMSSSVSTE